MTDKQIFDQLKAERKEFTRKKKMLKFMKAEVNRKLMFLNINEEDRSNLIVELQQIEINDFTLRRNKYNSKHYKFIPGPMFNRIEKKMNNV